MLKKLFEDSEYVIYIVFDIVGVLILALMAALNSGCGGAQEEKLEPVIVERKTATSNSTELNALKDAVRSGDVGKLKKLLAAGADINQKGHMGLTLLDEAAFNGNKQIIEFLMQHGAVSSQPRGAQLIYAVKTGDIESAKQIISGRTGPDIIKHMGFLLLHCSALEEHIDIVKMLIESGAPVNCPPGVSSSPLHAAAFKGNKEIVKLLINANAKVNARDWGGYTPYELAVYRDHTEVADYIRKRGGKSGKKLRAEFINAVKNGSVKEAFQLIQNGADVNSKEPFIIGYTALHHAVRKGSTELVRLLTANGADLNAKAGLDMGTPLHDAVTFQPDKEVAELLIKAGADVNATDGSGKTPLHKAAFWGRNDIVRLLIDSGGDTSVKDKRGRTPLDIAKHMHHSDIIKLLRGGR